MGPATLRDAPLRRFSVSTFSAPSVLSAGILTVALHTACAPPRGPLADPPRAVARIDAVTRDLIERGCYQCLEQALERAELHGAAVQAFEAAALLALRSKELGLPSEGWIAKARAHAGAGEPWTTYLEIVESIPPDRLSGSRDELADLGRRRQVRDAIGSWREQLQSGPVSDAFLAYLDVSLVCVFGSLRSTEESFAGRVDAAAATPLVQYAIGTCDVSHAPRLEALRAAQPDFVDADFALGRYALEDPLNPRPEEALERLQSAARAFPESPAITTRIGDLHRAWEEWPAALAAYDAALAASPGHPEALLGRVISLSYLDRTEEAIAGATRLIDSRQRRAGEAHYWRGWNHLRQGAYEQARADADRARSLVSNAAVLVLSGVVDARLGRLDSAEKDFQDALTMDLGACEAALDLGVVRDRLGRPAEALAAFRQAAQCYDLSIAVRREAIDAIRSGPGTATLKARESARHERVLADLIEKRIEAGRLIGELEQAAPAH